jgi:predicted Zn-dependent protease
MKPEPTLHERLDGTPGARQAACPPGLRSAERRLMWPALQRSAVVFSFLLLVAWPTVPQAHPSTANRLPDLGDTASGDMNLGEERRLGDETMDAIRRDPSYLDDPLLGEYVQTIWKRLLQAAELQGHLDADLKAHFALEPFVLRDRNVNAFALPGGYVGINLGLLATAGSTDELASVLAHELVHVTQRHIARGSANASNQSMVGMAAMIVGLLAASRNGNIQLASAAVTGGQALAIQGQLNFSRDMEREADRIGFGVLTEAGFDAAGMSSMFEMLEQASRFYDNTSFPYLRTHPLTHERIGEARARLGAQAVAKPAISSMAALMHSRAKVLMDTRVEALQRLAQQDLPPPSTGSALSRMTAAYEAALASSLLRDHDRARKALSVGLTALRQAPVPDTGIERIFALLTAEIALAASDLTVAVEAARRFADDSRPSLLMRAQIAAQAAPQPPALGVNAGGADPRKSAATTDDLDRSLAELQTWTATHPRDATAWRTLAELWARKGWALRAARAEAESRYAMGDLRGAIDRLRAAQKLERSSVALDPIEASVVDARARALEAQWRVRLAEMRRDNRSSRPD